MSELICCCSITRNPNSFLLRDLCHCCCADWRLMRTQFCQWVYDWHIHRFGLTNLAEINLADLIKSVQVCWKQSTKVTHFGQLTAIIQSRNLPRWYVHTA